MFDQGRRAGVHRHSACAFNHNHSSVGDLAGVTAPHRFVIGAEADEALFGATDEPRPWAADEDATATMGMTVKGGFLGTVAYTAPEQALGKTVDRRAHIFCFGILTGMSAHSFVRPYYAKPATRLNCSK